jgi:kynurenine formamidase
VKWIALASTLAALLACASDAPPSERVIDLTHPFDEETIYWPTEEGFVLERGPSGVSPEGYYYEAHRFRAAEHGGTHIDAPIHFFEGGWTLDQIPLERLIGPAVAIDVTSACARDRDYQVDVGDLQGWEARHGEIPAGAIVLLRTGFARFWPDRERYMGTAARGAAATAELHFPGLHPRAARWLVNERGIHAVGLDTASIDHGPSREFWSHRVLFEANVVVFENLAGLDALPSRGFSVIALPIAIRGGSGGPLRIIAILPD